MGLLDKLFKSNQGPADDKPQSRAVKGTQSRATKPAASHELPPNVVMLNGGGRVEVVGESQYEDAFTRICGPRCREGYDLTVVAQLVSEPESPYDPDAIRVEVQGLHVGYLARPAAKAFKPVAEELASRGLTGACLGTVRGGWERGKDTGGYGIALDLAAPDKAIRPIDR